MPTVPYQEFIPFGESKQEVGEAGFRDIRPSRRDAPCYQSVPDGNSENSVLSVLKKKRWPLPSPPQGAGEAGAMGALRADD